MALELREYCRASINSGQVSSGREIGVVPNSESASLPTSELSPQPQIAPVVPRGLRAFEASDADFFLRLLPGPYDRHGLPSALRFWKSRLESRSSSEAFSVGVVYGPSGCGKTSLFRAGLLPRLSPELDVLYIQATAQDTEKTLQTSLNGFLAQSVSGQTLGWMQLRRITPMTTSCGRLPKSGVKEDAKLSSASTSSSNGSTVIRLT